MSVVFVKETTRLLRFGVITLTHQVSCYLILGFSVNHKVSSKPMETIELVEGTREVLDDTVL